MERLEKVDKIMMNKYERLNSTVEGLGSEIINWSEKNGKRGKHRGRLFGELREHHQLAAPIMTGISCGTERMGCLGEHSRYRNHGG